MNIIQLSEVEDEVAVAITDYEQRRFGLGREFLVELRRGYQKGSDHPNRWPHVTNRARRYRLDRFPYGIVNVAYPDHVLIVAVMHLSRKPNYWRHRLP
jgi:hypothetical protein